MKKVLASVLFVAAALSPAIAATPERGNCLSLLTSNASGTTVSRAVHEVQALTEAQGIPFGQRVAQLARSEGTVQECLVILYQGE